MEIRKLARQEVADVWSIDRAERIERMLRRRDGAWVLVRERHDLRAWPPGEPEAYGPRLLDGFDRGGSFYGAFEDGTLVAAVGLESRFIGRRRDTLQLAFLHVGRRHRGTGLGGRLLDLAVARAREQGARRLYVSATPSENTVRFYARRGFRMTEEVDPALFELEPEDVHMVLEVPPASGRERGGG